MKFKLKNINFSNLHYLIQGYYKAFIKRQYNKYFGKDNVDLLMYKAASCPRCYMAGECIGEFDGDERACHCAFTEMSYSNKPCPCGNFK